MIPQKIFNNLQTTTLDLSNESIESVDLENCVIDRLVLPKCCDTLSSDHSTIKTIVVYPSIAFMFCIECGIENIIADEPLPKVRMLYLSQNKLTSFNLQITSDPYEIDLSYNKISEIKYKIPFHWEFNIHGNPIAEERSMREYIRY